MTSGVATSIKNGIIGFSPEDFKNRDNLRYPHPAANFSKNTDYSISKSSKLLVRRILDYAPLLKDQSFEKEKEWRIVTVREYPAITMGIGEIERNPLPFEMKFRDRGSLITPYIEVSLASGDKNVLIDELIIGPSYHRELSYFSLQAMLGYNIDFNATPSVTSYRYW